MKKIKQKDKAWIVSVRMGLGHQRAAYALSHLAEDGVLNAGEPDTSEEEELKLWHKIMNGYETISKVKNVPIIGNGLFNIVNAVRDIPPFYPIRDLSKPNTQSKLIHGYMQKGLGIKLMDKVKTKPLPMISTYFIPALIADYYNYSRNYCIVTDAEISRTWLSVDPSSSKTIYFAPCSRALYRLKEYGVSDSQIYLTGFPIPKQLLGNEKLDVLLPDLGQRLHQLDPDNRFWPLHGSSVEHFLGRRNVKQKIKRPLTILYTVGGAGLLWETGLQIAKSLKKQIMRKELRFALSPGVRKDIYDRYVEGLHELRIPRELVPIIYSPDTAVFFELFTNFIRETDILWTKPGELVFYSALGLPIIMTEPVGAQEVYNKKWLIEIQAGIEQEDPLYSNEWLLDLLHFGRFAECAWDGFLKARKYGVFKIEEILRTGTMVRETAPLRR